MTDSSRSPILDEQLFRVENGDIVNAGSWVYIWLEPTHGVNVLYVGATGVPPALRTWLHLNEADPNIGRVRNRYPQIQSNQALVLAFQIDDSLDRQEIKHALITQIEEQGLRSSRYFGDDATESATNSSEGDIANLIISILSNQQ